MSAASNDSPERRRCLSNVSFSSISPDVLLVRIRKMSGEVKEDEAIPKTSSTLSPTSPNPGGQRRNAASSKSNITENERTTTVSKKKSEKEQLSSTTESDSHQDYTPCLKHAAENISRKASVPSEKINLCSSCSKSMLAYIFLVQDFLDSLTKEISGKEKSRCLQCARQEARNSIANAPANHGDSSNIESTPRKHTDKNSVRQKDISRDRSGSKSSKTKSHHREMKRNYDYQRTTNSLSQEPVNQQIQNMPSPSIIIEDMSARSDSHVNTDKSSIPSHSSNEQWTPSGHQIVTQSVSSGNQGTFTRENSADKNESVLCSAASGSSHSPYEQIQHLSYEQNNECSDDGKGFQTDVGREQTGQVFSPVTPGTSSNSDLNNNASTKSPYLYRADIDGIVSTLSSVEREIYDSARNRAGWESFTESQARLSTPTGDSIASQAFVTSCRNNAEAIGCLVVGTSLLLRRTSRTLCVLVSDGVSTAFRSALSSIFQVVQYVRSLDSLGTTKLALLDQPELGISFEKLNVWRLVQFTKCVYLNPDTLVVQNCDELFDHDELSAVPDIGWPDCFNSGVFVFSPSVHTFWQLMEFVEKQGSYDGGDQGLLNSYFNSWSSDIHKKLSFIYNLMANVSYTYTPAFRQFGRDVKIVQFHGSFKPWHVKFYSKTGNLSPSSSVHPTYVQFVHIWINIFRITVLRLLSEEIQSYAATQEVISAVETLRFFPLPSESESDFFLTPPSVRLRLAEKKLDRSTSLPASGVRRKSAEFFRYTELEAGAAETTTLQKAEESAGKKSERTEEGNEACKRSVEDNPLEVDDVFNEGTTVKEDENTMPGSKVGDYLGMKVWEQGRMDYEGSDRSDNVIKRLEFLMSNRPG